MSEPRFKMGRVGGLTPPTGLAQALRDFDPELELEWNWREQLWMVVQHVRRRQYVGEYENMSLFEIAPRKVPVLYVTDTHTPDHRIIHQLQKQRYFTKKGRLNRQVKKMKDEKKRKDDALYNKFEKAREAVDDMTPLLRKAGFGGKSSLVAPKKGWELS